MTILDRRSFLRLAGAGVAASSAGCLGDLGDGAFAGWDYGTPGQVLALHDGTVYGREDFTEGSGGIVALDASTGVRDWTYGETGGYSMFTPPAVADALYFGYGDDAIGSGSGALYAVEHDGTERWVAETGSIYDRPRPWNGTVYAGSDDGYVYGFGADGGEEQLSVSLLGEEPDTPTVEAVEDGVAYVTLGGTIRALDVDDGEQRWAYDAGERRVSTVTVADAVYFATSDVAGALEAGEERWTHDFEADGWAGLRGVAHGAVYVAHGDGLHALDAGDGSERWRVEGGTVSVHDGGVYVGTDRLRALTADGEEAWTTALDGSEVGELVAAGASAYAATEEAIYRIDGDGEVVSTADVPGARSLVVGDLVYAGTDRGIYGLKL